MPCWAVVSGGGERALSQLKPRLGALSLKRRRSGRQAARSPLLVEDPTVFKPVRFG